MAEKRPPEERADELIGKIKTCAQKSENYIVTVSKHLAELRKVADEAGWKWSVVLRDRVKPALGLVMGDRQVRRLVQIGKADDPEAEAKRQKKARAIKDGDGGKKQPKPSPSTPLPAPEPEEKAPQAALPAPEPTVEEMTSGQRITLLKRIVAMFTVEQLISLRSVIDHRIQALTGETNSAVEHRDGTPGRGTPQEPEADRAEPHVPEPPPAPEGGEGGGGAKDHPPPETDDEDVDHFDIPPSMRRVPGDKSYENELFGGNDE